MKTRLNRQVIDDIVALIPDDWIAAGFEDPAATVRQVYAEFLTTRLAHSDLFVNQALHARTSIV